MPCSAGRRWLPSAVAPPSPRRSAGTICALGSLRGPSGGAAALPVQSPGGGGAAVVLEPWSWVSKCPLILPSLFLVTCQACLLRAFRGPEIGQQQFQSLVEAGNGAAPLPWKHFCASFHYLILSSFVLMPKCPAPLHLQHHNTLLGPLLSRRPPSAPSLACPSAATLLLLNVWGGGPKAGRSCSGAPRNGQPPGRWSNPVRM